MKITIVTVALLFTTAAFATTTTQAQSPTIDPNKPITITLPAQDWQWVIQSLSDSANVSARDANRIVQTIGVQAKPQITTTPAGQHR